MNGSIAAVITLGFGAWGSPGLVTTLGFGTAAVGTPGTALLRLLPAHGALLRFLPAAKPED